MSAFKEFNLRGACDLSVRDYGGSGSPVLLLHGASRNLADWTPFAQLLATNHHVVAMDLRNHGRSGDGKWEFDSVVDDVERVIDATGIHRPSVVGHSLGGMIAAFFSAGGGSARCVVDMDGYGMGHPGQYPGFGPDDVNRFLDETLHAFLDPWPGAVTPITREDIENLTRDRLAQADALGISVALELETIARSIRDIPGNGITMSPSAARMWELFDMISDVKWFEIFANVEAPFLLYRCVESTPFEIGDYMAFHASYREGLQQELAALAQSSTNVTVRILDTHHLCNLSMPDILAAEVHEFIETATSAAELAV